VIPFLGSFNAFISLATLTCSQIMGWNPLEGFTKTSCGKLKPLNPKP
jgi:hypothetical protein